MILTRKFLKEAPLTLKLRGDVIFRFCRDWQTCLWSVKHISATWSSLRCQLLLYLAKELHLTPAGTYLIELNGKTPKQYVESVLSQ